MKIKFLGTAAAEGFPAVFCNCEYCNALRKTGKGYRTRSQTIIDGKLLIDLPADTYAHFLHNGIKGDEIESLIITHIHEDHFYAKELDMRGGGFSKNMKNEVLNLLIPQDAVSDIENLNKNSRNTLSVNVAKPYYAITLNGYKITPLPARHGYGAIVPFIYLIESGNVKFLYAHDTGYFYPEVISYLADNNIVLDGISFDCCYLDIPISDSGAHMGYDNVYRLVDELTLKGVITDKTVKILNHFSHNGNPTQENVENAVKDKNYLVAYDGFEIQI